MIWVDLIIVLACGGVGALLFYVVGVIFGSGEPEHLIPFGAGCGAGVGALVHIHLTATALRPVYSDIVHNEQRPQVGGA